MLNPYDPNVTVEELKVESALLKRAAALRAHYDAAYLAALGGTCADPNVGDESLAIRFAKDAAIQSVRTHAARMQELDKLIAEVANG